MIEIYLGRNTSRNQALITFCEKHRIPYICKEVSQLTRQELLDFFARTADCFDLLSMSLYYFKRHRQMKLSELVTLILRKPEQYLRLPLVVYHKKVYPDITLEEARTFLPRNHKEILFRDYLFKNMTE